MTKEERLMELMGKISDEYIDEAHAPLNHNKTTTQKHKFVAWKSIATIAACVCILLVCLPTVRNAFLSEPEQPTTFSQETVTDDYMDNLDYIPYITCNGYVYEIFDTVISSDVLNLLDYESAELFFSSKGVPATITDTMVGKHICYLSDNSPTTYIQCDNETNIELLEYKAAPDGAVCIVKNNGLYQYAFICGLFSNSKPGSFSTLSNFYALYGIDNDSTLTSVSITDKKNPDAVNTTVTSFSDLQKYYMLTHCLEFCSLDDFQTQLLADLTQEEFNTFISTFDMEYISICMQSSAGLKLTLRYYPEYGYLYSNITEGCYKVPNELKIWFDDYISN